MKSIAAVMLVAAALASNVQAQPTAPAYRYAEWPIVSEKLNCEPIAASLEQDTSVRWLDLKGVTRVFVNIDPAGRLRVSGLVSRSGDTAVHQMVDQLAFDRLRKCVAKGESGDVLVEFRWDFGRDRTVAVTLRPGSPKEIVPPKLRADRCSRPEYPATSLRAREQGTTRLRFAIDETGAVAKADVERSSGFDALDQAARRALAACLFEPAKLRGTPLPGNTILTMDYAWRITP